MFRPYRMDASDVIRKLKEKTQYLNLANTFTALGKGAPASCASTINTVYNFDSYEERNAYFSGRSAYAQASTCITCSTCSEFCFR